ncbi:hypothetical protein IWX46DRAFT_14610 [Phyllosticta citricarpa]|uniref:Secreted protein n=1 Tax=Phyllosticta citricarpa TaxID=55181 RepID=A0ABR1MSF9_9PEZI
MLLAVIQINSGRVVAFWLLSPSKVCASASMQSRDCGRGAWCVSRGVLAIRRDLEAVASRGWIVSKHRRPESQRA